MNRSDSPEPPRMPGSVILAAALLGLGSLIWLVGGLSTISPNPPLGAALLAGALVNAALPLGLMNRIRWARTAAIVWCGLLAAFALVSIFLTDTDAPPGSTGPSGDSVLLGLFGFHLLLLYLVAHRNTRAWCDRGGGRFRFPSAGRGDR